MTQRQRVSIVYRLGRACHSHSLLPGAAAPLLLEVLATVEPAGFRPQDLSLCLTAAARAQCNAADAPVDALLQHLARAPPSFLAAATPQALCNMAWSLCKLECRDTDAWTPVALAAEEAVPGFQAIDVANMAYSLAASGVLEQGVEWGIPLLGLLARRAIVEAPRFNPQDLSNTAWAFAKAGMPNLPLFHALGGATLPRLPALNNQALTNVTWALVTVGYTPALLMARLHDEAAVRLAGSLAAGSGLAAAMGRRRRPLSATQLSVLAWSFQRSGHASKQLLESMAQAALLQLASFKSYELGRLLSALADANAYDADFFAIACAELRSRLDPEPQDLRTPVTLLRALSVAGHYDQQLVERVLHALHAAWLGQEGRLQAGRALEGGLQLTADEAMALGLVATCLGSLRHYDPLTLDLLAAGVEAQARVAPAAVSPFLLASVLSTHAFFGHRNPALFAAASVVLSSNPGTFQLPHLCQLLWAAGASGTHNSWLLRSLFQQLARYERGTASLRASDAGRLVHGMAFLEAAMSQTAWQRLVGAQPPPWRLVVAATELFCGSQAVVTSGLQRSVASALRHMGLEVTQEARTHDEIFVCDILVAWKGATVVLEADGPCHTTANPPERMVGPWALKDLCLLHRGYAVARIPAHRWAAARRSRQVQQLLTACMDAAVERLAAHDLLRQGRPAAVDADAGQSHATSSDGQPAVASLHPGRDVGTNESGAEASWQETGMAEVQAWDSVALGFHVIPDAKETGRLNGSRIQAHPPMPVAAVVPVRAPKTRTL